MGVSTGQVFQPRIMSVVEPQKRQSAWEQVLPTILTSLASTAAKGYVENQVEQKKLEQERLAKGYIKNQDGTWSLPPITTQDLGNNITGVVQGGVLKGTHYTDPLQAKKEERIAKNQEYQTTIKAAEAAGFVPDTSGGLSPYQAVQQGKWTKFVPTQTPGIGGTLLTKTKPGETYVSTGQVQEGIDEEGYQTKTYIDPNAPGGTVTKRVKKQEDKTQPTAFSDQNAYTQMQKFSEIDHPYSDAASSLTNVYGKIRKTEKVKPDEAFSEINNMGQLVTQYSQAYPTRESVADAVNRGEISKDQGLSLMKYYRYGGTPLTTQTPKNTAPIGPTRTDNTNKLKRILGFGGE